MVISIITEEKNVTDLLEIFFIFFFENDPNIE